MQQPSFQQAALRQALDALDACALDELEFGLIGIDADGVVQRYNALESSFSGLAASRVLGRCLFTVIAPCMNNAMVAGRFEAAMRDGLELDTTLDYVLALRMRPVKVRLRLLAGTGGSRNDGMRYVLVQRLG